MNIKVLENLSLQQRLCIETMVGQFNFEKEENRLKFVDMHESWVKGGSWGTNAYLKFGKNKDGKTGLYRTTRAVSNAQTDPTVSTSPQQYTFVGWSMI